MKLSSKFFLIFAAVTMAFSVLAAGAVQFGLTAVKNADRQAVSRIIALVREKYPDVDDRDIADVLNSAEADGSAEEFLRKYGVSGSDVIVLQDRSNFAGVVSLAVSVCIGLVCVSIICFGIYVTIRRKQDRKLTKYLSRINSGNYHLRFDDLNEEQISVLSSEIYKTTIMLREQSERSVTEKEKLKDSLSDISHQLKTPLQTLTLMGNQLMADDILTADRKRAARKILDTTARYSELVKTLLELSKLDAGAENFHMEDFTAERLIDRACETVEIVMELREIELVKNVPPQVMIHSDLKWLSQALMNIVKNCMEHTPAGGTVTIDVIDSATATDIVIRDTGPGISEEDLPHLFERFYKGKDSGPNSVGIGLAFTDQVVTALGGKVLQPENAPDGGAVFTVRLINKINV